MKFSRSLFSLALAAAIIASAMADNASATLLSNASFESELEFDPANSAGPNWFAFFGAGSAGTFSTVNPAFTGVADPTDGLNNLSITNDGTAGGFSGVFQQADVTVGVDYTFSFEARSNSGPTFPLGAEYRIEWVDAGGGVFAATPNIPIAGALTDSYQPFDITAEAPAGAARAQVVIAVETFSSSGAFGDLFVDNASFQVAIPEPTSLMLAGMSLATTLAMRRKR